MSLPGGEAVRERVESMVNVYKCWPPPTRDNQGSFWAVAEEGGEGTLGSKKWQKLFQSLATQVQFLA